MIRDDFKYEDDFDFDGGNLLITRNGKEYAIGGIFKRVQAVCAKRDEEDDFWRVESARLVSLSVIDLCLIDEDDKIIEITDKNEIEEILSDAKLREYFTSKEGDYAGDI